ncbi:DUF2971 domain-containing protein [Vibrio vulnificus]|nr:DUF2971 domain-containing protein [Vibrio vulnificus]
MNNFSNYSDYLHQHRPAALWHYTSLDVLNNVVNASGNLSFWVSEISYLNDHQEFKHGISIIKEVYEKFKSENYYLSKSKVFLDSIEGSLRFLEGLETNLSFSESAGVFVLSFTEKQDLLSQWRAYTPNCHGVSIGISPNFWPNDRHNSLLFPVIYNDEFKYEYAISLFKDAIDKCLEFTQENTIHNNNVIATFISQVKAACTLMKDSGFSEEAEWRYVIYGEKHQNISLRSSQYYLIPYIELSIPNHFLSEIVIGPNPHSELCRKSIDLLLSKSNVGQSITRISSIPYRG